MSLTRDQLDLRYPRVSLYDPLLFVNNLGQKLREGSDSPGKIKFAEISRQSCGRRKQRMGVKVGEAGSIGKNEHGLVTRGRLLLFTFGALVVGFVAGAIMGGIWEHRLAGPAGGRPQGMVSGSGAVALPEQHGELRALEARVARDPQDLEAWIQLGNLNYDMGRAAEAIRAYEKALALRPGDPDVITDMGTMYRLLGQPQKAVEFFREAHRLDPNHFNSLYNEGVVLLHDLNDMAGAARAWEEFLKLVPRGEQSERIRKILENLKSQGKIP